MNKGRRKAWLEGGPYSGNVIYLHGPRSRTIRWKLSAGIVQPGYYQDTGSINHRQSAAIYQWENA